DSESSPRRAGRGAAVAGGRGDRREGGAADGCHDKRSLHDLLLRRFPLYARRGVRGPLSATDLRRGRARIWSDGPPAGRGSYSRHAMAGSGRDERARIRGAQSGVVSDLDALFRRHWPAAFRAAYLVVHDAAAAEDIAQEAFLAAVRALDRFDRRRPFGPWLHRIVVNRAIDWTRARALRREVGGDAVLEAAAPE